MRPGGQKAIKMGCQKPLGYDAYAFSSAMYKTF